MTNKKAAYVDFSKPEYQSFSEKEIQLLKTVNAKGNRKNIKNCSKHGLHEPVFVKFIDTNNHYFGCLECFKDISKV
jgi:hypothetical protein